MDKVKLAIYLMFSIIQFVSLAQNKGMGKPVNGVAPAGTERRLALVIGNKDYQQVSKLTNPVNDAEDIRTALISLGFDVSTLTNADDVKMKKGFREFVTKVQPGDVVLFYYSGHGVSYGGKNYLLPIDVSISCLGEIEDYKHVESLIQALDSRGVRNSFVFLDACRNLPDVKPCPSDTRDIIMGKGLVKPSYNPSGSMIVYATAEGSIANDNSKSRNGLFTGELLKYLTVPNLSLRQILDRTKRGVEQASNRSQSPARYDNLSDEFYFVVSEGNSIQPTIIPKEPINVLPKPTVNKYLDLPFAEMAFIPGGSFQMGDTRNEGEPSEKPVHTVKLDGFYMGKYEVTQRQWESIMGSNPSEFKGCPDCPVENVSWDDIQAFLKELNRRTGSSYRLPTEAEWEYAAGGGANRRTRFGNGKDILTSSEANFNASADEVQPYSKVGEYRAKTLKVGNFESNGLGLYDMAGNVWEWCNDWYGDYASSPSTNPTGPDSGSYRVLRGGSWFYDPSYSRVAYRLILTPDYRSYNIGFRVVSPQ